jgi:hypothetical protein
MAARTVTLQLEGSPQDAGRLRLSELIQQLEFLKAALVNTERLVTQTSEHALYYRVVELSQRSPAVISVEAVPARAEVELAVADRTVSTFFENVHEIMERGTVPDAVDLPALESYRALGSLLKKNIAAVKLINSNSSVDIDQTFSTKVNSIIGADEIIEGSISGMLEWLNIHNANTFHIYPSVGPKKVTCNFAKDLRETVIRGIDRHVRVYGRLRYKRRDNFPYAVDASEIEILARNDELPTLASLRGICHV